MTLDLSYLFHASLGFDHFNRMLNDLANSSQIAGYPPYNILKLEENFYRISLALAGFEKNDLSITLEMTILTIKSSGKKNIDKNYLYKGIAHRAFEKKFRLAENIKIAGANLEKGLLNIDLIKIPPLNSNPKKIEITESKL